MNPKQRHHPTTRDPKRSQQQLRSGSLRRGTTHDNENMTTRRGPQRREKWLTASTTCRQGPRQCRWKNTHSASLTAGLWFFLPFNLEINACVIGLRLTNCGRCVSRQHLESSFCSLGRPARAAVEFFFASPRSWGGTSECTCQKNSVGRPPRVAPSLPRVILVASADRSMRAVGGQAFALGFVPSTENAATACS